MPRWVGDDSVTTALSGAVRIKQQGIQPWYRKGHKLVVFWFLLCGLRVTFFSESGVGRDHPQEPSFTVHLEQGRALMASKPETEQKQKTSTLIQRRRFSFSNYLHGRLS